MISTSNLLLISKDRLTDAETLLNAQRYDGAVYICGYSVEIALKYKICKTLNWIGFPSTNKEFEKCKNLKTHDLDILLAFTGVETMLKSTYLAEWSAITIWDPEARYNQSGVINSTDATLMISSSKILIGVL